MVGKATVRGGVHRNEMRWNGTNGIEGQVERHETERNRRENSTTADDSTTRAVGRGTGSGSPQLSFFFSWFPTPSARARNLNPHEPPEIDRTATERIVVERDRRER